MNAVPASQEYIAHYEVADISRFDTQSAFVTTVTKVEDVILRQHLKPVAINKKLEFR